MKLKWFGHSCFLLTSNSGVRILTDPFNEKVGYMIPSVEADIVSTSHDHYDHGSVEVVKGNFIHLKEPGIYHKEGVTITGTQTYHDQEKGAKRGNNIIYKFNIDGINVCHCGDLGHIVTKQQISEIGEVDLLLLPVGGIYTIDYKNAVEVMKLINPRLTIPMHYYTKVLSFQLDNAEKFLEMTGGKMLSSSEIELDKEKKFPYSGVLALSYA